MTIQQHRGPPVKNTPSRTSGVEAKEAALSTGRSGAEGTADLSSVLLREEPDGVTGSQASLQLW